MAFHCNLIPLIGETPSKHIFKIPLSNLVGRSIERPLKSPLQHKVVTTSTSSMVAVSTHLPVQHSLSCSRMEIKEIASRTRKELLGESLIIHELSFYTFSWFCNHEPYRLLGLSLAGSIWTYICHRSCIYTSYVLNQTFYFRSPFVHVQALQTNQVLSQRPLWNPSMWPRSQWRRIHPQAWNHPAA